VSDDAASHKTYRSFSSAAAGAPQNRRRRHFSNHQHDKDKPMNEQAKQAMAEAWAAWHKGLEGFPDVPNPSFDMGFRAGVEYVLDAVSEILK
jgi:hypothetical protein